MINLLWLAIARPFFPFVAATYDCHKLVWLDIFFSCNQDFVKTKSVLTSVKATGDHRRLWDLCKIGGGRKAATLWCRFSLALFPFPFFLFKHQDIALCFSLHPFFFFFETHHNFMASNPHGTCMSNILCHKKLDTHKLL